MTHRLIFLLSILFTGQYIIAKQVPIAAAKQAALQFYSERYKQYSSQA